MSDERSILPHHERIQDQLREALAAVNGLELEHSFGKLLDALHEAAVSGVQLTEAHNQIIGLIRRRVETTWPETVFGYRGDLQAPPDDEV